jgi:hypothetical protein
MILRCKNYYSFCFHSGVGSEEWETNSRILSGRQTHKIFVQQKPQKPIKCGQWRILLKIQIHIDDHGGESERERERGRCKGVAERNENECLVKSSHCLKYLIHKSQFIHSFTQCLFA